MNHREYLRKLDELTAVAVEHNTAGEVSAGLISILSKVAIVVSDGDANLLVQLVESLRHSLDIEVCRMLNDVPA